MAIHSLSWDELRRLLAAARVHSEREFLMILVGFCHGLRASEICNLRAGDIQDGYITVQRLKGSKKTVQKLIAHSDPLFDEKTALVEFIDNQVATDRVFGRSRWTLQRIMWRHGKTAGLPRYLLHPHVLKHTTAMILLPDMSIPELQAYLGHEDGGSTMEYTEIAQQQASDVAARALKSRS